MQCLQINKLEFPDEIGLIVHDQLCQLIDSTTSKGEKHNDIKASDIFKTFNKDTNFTSARLQNNTNTDATIKVVGKSGRFLMFLAGEEVIPSIVFMTPPHSLVTKKNSKTASDRTTIPRAINVDIYLCQVCDPVSVKSLHSASEGLLQMMKDTTVDNMLIMRRMQLLVRPIRGFTPLPTEVSIEISKGEQVNIMKVTEHDLHTHLIRDTLRNVGVLPYDNDTTKIIIAQRNGYSLQMMLHNRKLHLFLYEIESIFNKESDLEELQPVVVLSTSCHQMDHVVEETYQLEADSMKPRVEVKGMMAVLNTLLRTSMVATQIHSIGFDYDVTYNGNIAKDDIINALCALNLMSDKEDEVHKFNSRYSRRIITPMCSSIVHHTEGTVHVSGELIPHVVNTSNFRVDYRLRNSDALNHAIYHHNRSSLKQLYNKHGIDKQEISTAMYSGISFCHSLKYKSPIYSFQSDDISTLNVKVINTTDFPGGLSFAIKQVINCDAAKVFVSGGPWSSLRHNSNVFDKKPQKNKESLDGNEDIEKRESKIAGTTSIVQDPLSIKFHITENGLIFFRTHVEDRINFVGAVYIVPCIHRLHSNKSFLISTHELHNTFDEIIGLIHLLNNQHIDSKEALIKNSTTLLFCLNVICANNSLHKKKSSVEHAMLRKAWLFSQMVKASVLCGGVQNAEFCSIYSHLASLSELPRDSVGYWSMVPYI